MNDIVKLPKVPKPPRGRVVEPAWPMAEGLVHHLRNDGRWYELRGIDEKTGDLLWHPSDLSALW